MPKILILGLGGSVLFHTVPIAGLNYISSEQNLDAIEPSFEKFNPNQIDNWRKIWKS
jgi:hypothetical protein